MPFPENGQLTLYFRERSRTAPLTRYTLVGQGPERTSENNRFRLRWNHTRNELNLTLRQYSGPVVYLDRLELARVSRGDNITLNSAISPRTPFRIFQQGFQSWSATSMRESHEADNFARLRWKHDLDENPETPHQGRWGFSRGALFPAPGKFHSESFVGLEEVGSDNPHSILVSVCGPGRQFVRYRVVLAPLTAGLTEFTVIWDFNGVEFKPHSIASLTPIHWKFQVALADSMGIKDGGEEQNGEDNHTVSPGASAKKKLPPVRLADLIDENIRDIAPKFNPRKLEEGSLTGWCSWYHYYTRISEDIILKNLQAVNKRGLELDFFQIDDGYQSAIGDWLTTNENFPRGMKFLAERIEQDGYRPGLWLAPFLAQKSSEIFQKNPEMILRAEDGSGRPVRALYNPNWEGNTCMLDITHPRSREWLSEVIHTMVYEWGFPYLKLDFLYAVAYRGLYHDPSLSGAHRLQKGLELIRKAAGKKTFLLGCGCPLFTAPGILDGMRIGKDVNSLWSDNLLSRLLRDRNFPSIRGALVNVLTRSAFHRRFWLNDPDCLMVRKNNKNVTENQILLMASVLAVSGGMLLISDDMTRLSEERFELIERVFQLNRECAAATPLPLGLMRDEFPRGLYNPAGYLGVWNPTSRPERIRLKFPARLDTQRLATARDFWTGVQMPWKIEADELHISLGPFESMVARIR